MAGSKTNAVPVAPISEHLLYDTRSGVDDEDLPTLFAGLEKTQGNLLAAAIKGLRGFNITDYNVKIYATRIGGEGSSKYAIRCVAEFNGTPAIGKNLEYVRSKCLDAESKSPIPEMG